MVSAINTKCHRNTRNGTEFKSGVRADFLEAVTPRLRCWELVGSDGAGQWTLQWKVATGVNAQCCDGAWDTQGTGDSPSDKDTELKEGSGKRGDEGQSRQGRHVKDLNFIRKAMQNHEGILEGRDIIIFALRTPSPGFRTEGKRGVAVLTINFQKLLRMLLFRFFSPGEKKNKT